MNKDLFDKYDLITDARERELYFTKYIYPHYERMINHYLNYHNIYDPDERNDIFQITIMKLLRFQRNRYKYKILNYKKYILSIIDEVVLGERKRYNEYRDRYTRIDTYIENF